MFSILLLWLLGASCASFGISLASRLLAGQSIISPRRSYCDACHHPLTWWQLIPVAGWVIQGGHCHFCHQAISCWSTAWEILCGTSFVILFHYDLPLDVATIVLLLTLSFLATTDQLQMVIFPIALVGLCPLLFLLPWCFPQTRLSLFLFLLYVIVIFLIHYCHLGLGFGDCLLLILILFMVGPLVGSGIILAACLMQMPTTILSRKPHPFVPAIALSILFCCDLVALRPTILAFIWASNLI